MAVRNRGAGLVAVLAVGALAVSACAGPPGGATDEDGPIRVGVLLPVTGDLSSFAPGFREGMEIGLDYATDGSGEVDGRPVELEFVDDGTDPATAVTAATTLVGEGVSLLAGTISSGVAPPVAELAGENDVLFINGASTTDAVTGVNRQTFRANRGTYQEIANIAEALPEAPETLTVLAQDNAFGQGSADAAAAVFESLGAEVSTELAPAAGSDFTAVANRIENDGPDALYVIWAGANLGAVWQAVEQQGILESDTTVATVVGSEETWASYPEDSGDIVMGSPYLPGLGAGEAGDVLNQEGTELNVQSAHGFATSQMIVRALSEGSPDDTESMVDALEGWTFESPKGETTVRAEDHAILEPMYVVRLVGGREDRDVELVATTPAEAVTPPVVESSWGG